MDLTLIRPLANAFLYLLLPSVCGWVIFLVNGVEIGLEGDWASDGIFDCVLRVFTLAERAREAWVGVVTVESPTKRTKMTSPSKISQPTGANIGKPMTPAASRLPKAKGRSVLSMARLNALAKPKDRK